MKNICLIICFIISTVYFSAGFAEKYTDKHAVNILTWWGYLNYPEIITGAEKECGVKISFDQYYSNDEFLRRWRDQKASYDVIIFSDTIYDGIKNEIPNLENSQLWKKSNQYHPNIKHHYLNHHYPHNIAFFVLSLTGFLYNPQVVSLDSNDSITDMFKKSKNNIVVIIDDPIEAKKLLTLDFKKIDSNDDFPTPDQLKELYQQADVYVGNGSNQINKDKNFAFSFLWSGAALKQIERSHLKYKFLIHPKLSYISSDMLAQITDSKSTSCVSAYLSSEKTLNFIEKNVFYFSPFAANSNNYNYGFQNIYKQFLELLPYLPWIEHISPPEFNQVSQSWEAKKLDLINKEDFTKTLSPVNEYHDKNI